MAGVSNPSGKDPNLLANLVKESLGALKTRYNQDLNKLVSIAFLSPTLFLILGNSVVFTPIPSILILQGLGESKIGMHELAQVIGNCMERTNRDFGPSDFEDGSVSNCPGA